MIMINNPLFLSWWNVKGKKLAKRTAMREVAYEAWCASSYSTFAPLDNRSTAERRQSTWMPVRRCKVAHSVSLSGTNSYRRLKHNFKPKKIGRPRKHG